MWYRATSATVSNGSDVVTINTGDDVSSVQEQSGLVFEDGSPVEVLKAYIDGSNQYIQLSQPWAYASRTNQPLVVYPTDADFATATAELRRVIDTLEVAGTVEAQEGTNDEKIMSPLKVKQAIDFNIGTSASKDIVTSTTDTTAGRLLTVGYGGLGGSRIAKQTFGNDLVNVVSGSSGYNGMIVEVAVDTANKPSIARSDVAGFVSVNGTTLLFTAIFPTAEVGNIYTGIYSGTDLIWRKTYDSGNTNFNDFGGIASDDLIGVGFAFNSSTAIFNLPKNSVTAPSSISVAGTFEIRNYSTLRSSGAVPTILSGSSNKMLHMVITGIDGSLVAGESLRLITESATSKITVNY